MPSIYRRKMRDGRESPKWTVSYKGADGKFRAKVAYTDKAKSLELGVRLETEAAQVRDGMIAPAELSRREATRRVLKDHVEDYRRHLLAKGGTAGHANKTAKVIGRVLDDTGVKRLGDITPDRIQAALGRLRAARSPRTVNHALGAVRAFANWLRDNDRIEGHRLKGLAAYSQEVDRKRERRALTPDELARLIRAAEQGGTLERYAPMPNPGRKSTRGGDGSKGRKRQTSITGPERAMLYRIATETGFRADEIRSLTRDSFRLDGPTPLIVCEAAYTKNGRRAEQPIRPEFATMLRSWLVGRSESGPVVPVPEKTAKLLRRDLEAAGIPYRDGKGHVCDFHSLRGTFITLLVNSGANIKTVQALARHSTITLTMDVYARAGDDDKARALDGLPKGDIE